MVDDDDEGFGDFKFAQPYPTVHSNSSMINGPDSSTANNDDDDWGDFINPGGLPHAVSLPRLPDHLDTVGLFTDQKVKNEVSESTQPGSAPGRFISGMDQWKKPTGALPLSIFGELEEEGESGAEVPSLSDSAVGLFSSKNGDSVKKGSSTNVNDLIANLYGKTDSKIESGPDLNRSNSVEEMNVNGLSLGDIERNSNSREPDFSWNWVYSNANGKVELALDSKGLDLDWDPLNLNPNGLNLDKDISKVKSISDGDNLGFQDGNEKLDNDDDEDGWEFKDAQPKTLVGEEICKSQPNQIKAENGPVSNLNGFNSTWNSLSFDLNGFSSLSSLASSTYFLNTGPVNQNGEHAAAASEEDDADDDGWEFKVADSKTQVGDGIKDGPIKNEHMLNFNGSGLSWDVLSSDSSGLKPHEVSSDEKQLNANLIDEYEFDVADAWAFKGAEPDLKVTDGKPKISTENGAALNPDGMSSSLSTLSLDTRTGSNLDGENSNLTQGNLNLFDNENVGGNERWEFKTGGSAYMPGDGNTKDDGKMQKDLEGARYAFGFDSGLQDPGDLFGAPQRTSQILSESKSEFDFSSNKSWQNSTEDKLPFSPVNDKLGSVENSWAFKDVFSEVGPKNKEENNIAEVSPTVEALVFDGGIQENKVAMDNHKRALPLSIFGDEENEPDDPVVYQDISIQTPTSDPINVNKKPQVDINDLISSLYSQAVQNISVNHEQIPNGNALNSSNTGIGFNSSSDNHDFDDDSWEFQDASFEAQGEIVLNQGESLTKYSTETDLNVYVEFFSKLREELYYIALQQLENLKKVRSAAALTEGDAKIQALDKEIKNLESELQDNIISSEVFAENPSPGKICLNAFVEVLQEPKFQLFSSEYQLTKKLSLAETDCRSTIELLNCVALTVNILTSLSREEQFSYISAWSKMLSVCAQELRHGAFIWKQAMEENFESQILSKPQGKEYVLALGEIYRVAEVLGSSAKLYKPWILARSADSMCIFTLMSECSSLWSSSGLEEALQSILSSADFEYDGSLQTLLESIKYIKDLDVCAIYSLVFSRKSPTCQLSALTAGLVPGMKTIAWNGKHYILPLANLWANLVSSEPPNLPCIHVG